MIDLYLKSAASLVPGYEEDGLQHGELVPIDRLLQRMCSCDASQLEFVKGKMGFESIAFTSTTLRHCEHLWNDDVAKLAAFQESRSLRNQELYEMLVLTTSQVVEESRTRRFLQHIHITPSMGTSSIADVRNSLRQANVDLAVPSLIVPEGCSGVLTSIQLAQSIVTSSGGGDVLITGESDMLLHSHQRIAQEISKDNINDWLWGAIFGEGVGSLVVGTGQNSGSSHPPWRISKLEQDVVVDDWRVTAQWNDDQTISEIAIKAHDVKRTYVQYVSENVQKVIQESGGTDNLKAICMHESNPRIIDYVRDRLDLGDQFVPTISKQTGTLACVSAFTLLDHSINRQREVPGNIGMAVIGEAIGVVRAGRLLLEPVLAPK